MQHDAIPKVTNMREFLNKGKTCAREGCDKPCQAYGLCNTHYYQIARANRRAAEGRIVKDSYNPAFAFWRNVEKTEGCWLWNGMRSRKGWSLAIYQGKRTGANRVSWMLHNGPIPEGLFVCHTCDNPLCVRPDHLWLGTQGDNMRDMVSKGRAPNFRGEKNPRARLKAVDVETIRTLHKTGQYTYGQLAALYKLSKPYVGDIIRGERWSSTFNLEPMG